MRANKSYTEEFRTDVVALYRSGQRTKREVAEDLGLSCRTLETWVARDAMKRKRPKPGGARTPAIETSAEKIARLEREVAKLQREKAQLEMDRAILKKAAAFFAKENE
jgi:transposase